MFHVYLFAYKICENRWGHVIHVDANRVFNGLRLDDPMEVVQLFHEIPDNSVMIVCDDRGDEYRFSKGELLESEEDTDIDLFSWYCV